MPTQHEIAVTFTAKDAGLEASIKRTQGLLSQLNGGLRGIDGTQRGTTSSTIGLASSVRNLALQYVGAQAAIRGVSAAFGASSALEQQSRAWQGITGNVAGGRKELDFTRESADKLGVRFTSLEGGYRKIAASAKGSTLEGAAARQIFLDIAQAQQVLGASSDDVSGSMRALSQMISTGVVQADELRNELGNSLPGVMNIAARSMNMTTQEFRKLQETGGILTETFLPKFARMVKETFVVGGGDAATATRTLGQEAARAMNVLERFLGLTIQDSGLQGFLTYTLKMVTDIAAKALEGYENFKKLQEARGLKITEDTPGLAQLRPEDQDRIRKQLSAIDQQMESISKERARRQSQLTAAQGSDPTLLQRLQLLTLPRAIEASTIALERLAKAREALTQGIGALPRKPGGPFLGEDYGALTMGPTAAEQLTPTQKHRAELKTHIEQYGAMLLTMGKSALEIAEEQLKLFEKAQKDAFETQSKNLTPPPAEIKALLDAAAARYGMDPATIEALARQESNFNPGALSRGGAMGVMQIMPKTGAALGLSGPEFFDAAKSIDAGVRYFAQLLQQFGGDVRLALTAYNAGPGALERTGRRPELLPHQENREFAANVLGKVRGPQTMPFQDEVRQLQQFINEQKGLEVAEKASTEATLDQREAIAGLIIELTQSNTALDASQRLHILEQLAMKGASAATMGLAEGYHAEMSSLEALIKAEEQQLVVQKAFAEQDEMLLQIRERSVDGIEHLLDTMREGLPTIEDYETALRKLRGLDPGEGAVALAESYRERSTAAFQAITDGAQNLAGTLQSTLIDALTGGKDAWKQFGDVAVKELLRILLNATQFQQNIEQLLTKAGLAILKLFGPSTGAGAFDNSAYGSPGGVELAEGGPLMASQKALTGEQGAELLVTRSGMRLVGQHGPEVIRSREAGYVLPHRATMTVLGGIARRAMGGPIMAGMPVLVGDGAVPQRAMGGPGGQSGPIVVHLNLNNVRDAQSFIDSRRQVQRAIMQSVAAAQRSI